jgi:hypothetical protein
VDENEIYRSQWIDADITCDGRREGADDAVCQVCFVYKGGCESIKARDSVKRWIYKPYADWSLLLLNSSSPYFKLQKKNPRFHDLSSFRSALPENRHREPDVFAISLLKDKINGMKSTMQDYMICCLSRSFILQNVNWDSCIRDLLVQKRFVRIHGAETDKYSSSSTTTALRDRSPYSRIEGTNFGWNCVVAVLSLSNKKELSASSSHYQKRDIAF